MTSGERGGEDIFLVFVEGKPGREAAYADWFAGGHMADMRALPGVSSAHAFRLAQANGPAPAELCAIYEFAAGAEVLDTIGRSKGTDALPHSDDQGRMVWRLFETVETWPRTALTARRDVVLALLAAPRDQVDLPTLSRAGAAVMAQGAQYARALRLSPVQPSRGSEYGAALVVVWSAGEADPIGAVAIQLDRHFPGLPGSVLLAAPLTPPRVE